MATVYCLEQGVLFPVVNAATTTGVGSSVLWGVQPSLTRAPILIDFQCSGTFSVCTANLQQSFDGGTTFVSIGAAVDLYANQAGNLTTFFAVGAILAGPVYRLSIATFTGTSITVTLAVS